MLLEDRNYFKLDSFLFIMEKVHYKHTKDAVIESVAYNLNIDSSDAEFYLTMPLCEQRIFAEMRTGENIHIRMPSELVSRLDINERVDEVLAR
mgnify:CR=1 FL=1